MAFLLPAAIVACAAFAVFRFFGRGLQRYAWWLGVAGAAVLAYRMPAVLADSANFQVFIVKTLLFAAGIATASATLAFLISVAEDTARESFLIWREARAQRKADKKRRMTAIPRPTPKNEPDVSFNKFPALNDTIKIPV